MKRVLLSALCLILLALPCLAEEAVYYVNPDGGRYFHADRQCPSMSEAYWPNLLSLTAQEMTQAPYADLAPCPVCGALPSGGQAPLEPWLDSLDTAQDVRIETPGAYQLAAGLYTVVTDAQCDGLLSTSLSDGTTVHAFAIRGEASYSFYLGDGMSVTLPEHAVLTPIVKRADVSGPPEQETIRQGRRMLLFEMQPLVYAASPIDGEEGCVIFTPLSAEEGVGSPTVISLPAGAVVTFDTCIDGIDDPMPLKYFADPAHRTYFVEFVNCVVRPIDADND